ncbi:MAG: class II aldolase/adducin family protein [SAR202 cluster bacterium]|nr:class II aldolase/adducin family protein [SAR202 cluster bacterium]MDP6513329.1 class II aldolase/adducin family protein [SAR202 cluster bacterium]MDP6716680.1 class II aldolase/adducin family protein [SAR202 cluster bacterium]
MAETARAMSQMGLVTGASGNVSTRLAPSDSEEPLLAITPMATSYATMEADDIVVTDFDIEPVEGELMPSSESMLHVAIYQARPDVGAVIHTHSVYSSVLAVSGLDIPPVLDEVVVNIGGPIRVSEYGFPSSEALAQNVTAALGDRKAAIIANHGAVGVGRDLEEALEICALVERVSEIFVHATALGQIIHLPPEAVEAETAIYRMRNSDIGGVE